VPDEVQAGDEHKCERRGEEKPVSECECHRRNEVVGSSDSVGEGEHPGDGGEGGKDDGPQTVCGTQRDKVPELPVGVLFFQLVQMAHQDQ